DPETGSEHFPRTDPAFIHVIANTDDDGAERVLLGYNAAREADRSSLLPGSAEPGATLERAVIREIWEEAHHEVTEPQYLASRPLPSRCSFMLGFSAEAPSCEFAAERPEIATLRWFTREELRDAIAAKTVRAPSTVS